MCGNGIIDCVCGPNPVFAESRIDRFGDGLATERPFTANIHNRFSGLACAMKCHHKPSLGQHAPQRRFIEISARNMQGFLVACPKKACELIPSPPTRIRNRPHDFRGAGLDAAAVRRRQQTQVDLAIPERDAKVSTKDVPIL